MSNLLVTGAAGFIGSHTCDRLLAGGHTVTGVDNFRTGRAENLLAAKADKKFRFVEADITRPKVLSDLLSETRPDAVIHLAALVSVQESIEDPALNFSLNVELTHKVAEAARTYGVRRIVYASSAAVYGDTQERLISERAEKRPISPYGAAKLASEALLLGHGAAYGFTVRCQRYFNVFGPRQDARSPYSGVISIFCDRLRAGGAATIYGDGEQTRDFVSVHDVARANVLAATTAEVGSGIANICSGRSTSLNHLAELLRDLIPHAPSPLHVAPKAGDIRHSLGDATTAEKELGFTASVSLRAGLAEIVLGD